MLKRAFSSVDPAETLKFSRYQWWDPHNLLHPLTDLRVTYIKRRLGVTGLRPFKGINVLDIGCGGGLLAERLGRLGANVTGIDPTVEAIEVSSSHLPNILRNNVKYINCEVQDINDSFDLVVASEVIEHVLDPAEFIQEVAKKAKEGGAVFLSTVARTIQSYVKAILIAEYVLGVVEPGTHHWDKFINKAEMVEFCDDAGLVYQDCVGWDMDLLTWEPIETEYAGLGYLMWTHKHTIK